MISTLSETKSPSVTYVFAMFTFVIGARACTLKGERFLFYSQSFIPELELELVGTAKNWSELEVEMEVLLCDRCLWKERAIPRSPVAINNPIDTHKAPQLNVNGAKIHSKCNTAITPAVVMSRAFHFLPVCTSLSRSSTTSDTRIVLPSPSLYGSDATFTTRNACRWSRLSLSKRQCDIPFASTSLKGHKTWTRHNMEMLMWRCQQVHSPVCSVTTKSIPERFDGIVCANFNVYINSSGKCLMMTMQVQAYIRQNEYINRDHKGANDYLLHYYFAMNPVYSAGIFKRKFRAIRRCFVGNYLPIIYGERVIPKSPVTVYNATATDKAPQLNVNGAKPHSKCIAATTPAVVRSTAFHFLPLYTSLGRFTTTSDNKILPCPPPSDAAFTIRHACLLRWRWAVPEVRTEEYKLKNEIQRKGNEDANSFVKRDSGHLTISERKNPKKKCEIMVESHHN
ncbi:hypothetical protein LXL04_001996 [Taraxacum kok-saghyz]